MTGKAFFSGVVKDGDNILERFLALLTASGAPYCVIGGLAVNAYAEPLVSLDFEDKTRRRSKRQKDLADITRLVETEPRPVELVPEELRTQLD